MTAHTKAELTVLGVLEDSLGDRHRSTNGVTPGAAVGREVLAEMLDLERTIDLRVHEQRLQAEAERVSRRSWLRL